MMKVRPVGVRVHEGFMLMPMRVRGRDRFGVLMQVMAVVVCVSVDVLSRAMAVLMQVLAPNQDHHRDQKQRGCQQLQRRHPFTQ